MADSKIRKISFQSRDGFALHGEWHPGSSSSRPGKVVIVAPGMGVPARFYRPFARYLSKQGLNVLLFDFRGIGWSGVSNLKRLKADATTWGRYDLGAAIDFACDYSGSTDLIGIGHSFGGSVFGFTENIRRIGKMVHVCSQSGFYGLYDWKIRSYLLFNIYLSMPLLTRWLGYYPAHWMTGSEALPAGFVSEWSAWCQQPEYFMDTRFDVKDSCHHDAYHGPLLSLSFTDDTFATKYSVDKMASYYPNSQVERVHISPAEAAAESLGHFGAFKPSNGKRVWKLISDWIIAS
jgi:predicted alpha/beta hydrolase